MVNQIENAKNVFAAGIIGILAVIGFLGPHRRMVVMDASKDSIQTAAIQPVS